jgi:cob(I)alamin adenosyltransferase
MSMGRAFNKKKKDVVVAKRGLVLCNIGDGKGKTTAAMGQAVRVSGAGQNVFILQFVKAKKKSEEERVPGEWPVSNEVNFFEQAKLPVPLGKIVCEQVGEGFVGILGDQKARDMHIREALRGLERARQVITSGEYKMIILDEILSAVDLELLTQDDIIELIKNKPSDVHLMLTGHKKYPRIFKYCDTVTEMKMLQHAYYEGVQAQEGLDY